MIPGEIMVAEGDIELNAGRESISLLVENSGDRPVQVGSHYHFFETGQSREVTLIPYAGSREVFGFNARINGKLEG